MAGWTAGGQKMHSDIQNMSVEHAADQVWNGLPSDRKQLSYDGRRYDRCAGKESVYDVLTLQQSVW